MTTTRVSSAPGPHENNSDPLQQVSEEILSKIAGFALREGQELQREIDTLAKRIASVSRASSSEAASLRDMEVERGRKTALRKEWQDFHSAVAQRWREKNMGRKSQ